MMKGWAHCLTSVATLFPLHTCQPPGKKQSPDLSKPPRIKTRSWDRQPEPSMEKNSRKESCWLRLTTPTQDQKCGDFGMFAHMSYYMAGRDPTPECEVNLFHIHLLHTIRHATNFRMLQVKLSITMWDISPCGILFPWP